MRYFRWGMVVAVLAGLIGFGYSFTPARLPIEAATAADVLPPVSAQERPRVSAFMTGYMSSLELFAYRGGGFKRLDFAMAAVLIRHPQGNLLIDAGFGRNLQQHLETIPWLMRQTSRAWLEMPVANQLAAAGVAQSDLLGVILTHAHWDHVSGLDDLRGVPVLINASEREFIRNGHLPTELARRLGALAYRSYVFDGGPYAGFAESHDVFGDGSVVLVKAGGHTPGSVIVFVAADNGKRYAFIGDLAWHHVGVDLPAERPWVTRTMVDEDPLRVREDLVILHRLQAANPDLVIVPAHDVERMRALAPFQLH